MNSYIIADISKNCSNCRVKRRKLVKLLGYSLKWKSIKIDLKIYVLVYMIFTISAIFHLELVVTFYKDCTSFL